MTFFSLKTGALIGCLCLTSIGVAASTPVYLNANIGFDVTGFNYQQPEFPCDVDKQLAEFIVKKGADQGLSVQTVTTSDKVHNTTIPVLAIDIEQLVLTEDVQYGTKSTQVLPKIVLKTALNMNGDVTLAKHQCAIATLSEFTSSSDILDMGTVATVCSAVRKCSREVSDDVVAWLSPLVNTR